MKIIFTLKVWKHILLLVCVVLFSGNMFAQTKHIVDVTKNKFTPADLKISPGDTVLWRNADGFHNVNGTQTTFAMNPESFGNSTGVNWTFSHVFTKSGKYGYQCDPHVGLGMVGTIEVIAAGPKKYIVEVTRNKFTPADLQINTGDTVLWRNADGFHNVNGTQTTYAMNPESFGNNTGVSWTYSHVFSKSGKYDYQCDPHVGLGMVGTIIVNKNTTTFSPGIAESYGKSKLFPNPASTAIELKLPSEYSVVRSIKVYSISGSMVGEKKYSGKSESIKFDISQFKNGIYFMEINSVNSKEVLKFVKQ